ncbi:hypothetical protein BZG25_11995 [Salinivibrio sp. ML198]|uniref:GNAT family N-acetyltransferase n=1 Tax=unclassified Salinivibrio TaxID=2636825 RepID=UPI0009875174|nr:MULTISPECIES: GNAT family N-acetyltransferase [unclassified Salinivibrio]OOE64264.1 hypothetical protein BZG20_15030 [Salinivibrio sp. IB868]OOE72020.1 hypothetical protein BZG22_14075 [Salinivibrio sp. IB870]OOE78589.1 hypothetical protein BZG25_11995 [Salinivibrio sp. ML198]
MEIRAGHLEEAVTVLNSVPELDAGVSLEQCHARLAGRTALVLVGYLHGEPVGAKIGYATSETQFYSWLGGVTKAARGKGVAKALLKAQEAWVDESGYQTLAVKSRNRFTAMVCMLVCHGYQIVALEEKGQPADYRLYFEKKINN